MLNMATTGAAGQKTIRLYREGDRAAVYDICVRTGDHGDDATGMFEHPDLLPDIYAGPYLCLEPSLCFVLDDGSGDGTGGRPAGYVLGTADTARFVTEYRQRWLPGVVTRYPPPPGPPAGPEDELLAALYCPERMLVPELGAYSAHLHIDLLPGYQGGGYGRRLMETFLDAVAKAGASGVHVVVAEANTKAHGFYLRMGFEEVPVEHAPGVVYYGRKTVM